MQKKYLFIGGFALLIIPFLTGCSRTEAYDYQAKRVRTAKVETAVLSGELEFSGNIEANKETVISPKIGGRISSIKAGIGDVVKKGEILAELSGEENLTSRNTAGAGYQNSQSAYNSTVSLTEQKVNEARAGLQTAKENLDLAKKALTNQGQVSKNQIEKAGENLSLLKIRLENLKNTFDQQERNILDSALAGMQSAYTLLTDSISYIYASNGKTLNEDFNDFRLSGNFLAKNAQNEIDAEWAVKQFNKEYFEYADHFQELIASRNISREDILRTRDRTEAVLRLSLKTLNKMASVAADSIPNQNINGTELSSIRSGMSNYAGQASALLLSQDAGSVSGIVGVRQNLKNLEIDRESNLNELNKQIDLAAKELELLKSSVNASDEDLESRVSIAEAEVKRAEESLESARQARDLELDSAKMRLDMARGELNMAGVQVENTLLRAPYDGAVSEKLAEEGAVVSAGTPVLRMADMSGFKLAIYVPESEINQIKIGQSAQAMLESYPGENLSATVARISPKTETGSKKVRVEMSIEKKPFMKIGMYMTVKFELAGEKEALAIPESAIENKYGDSIVYTVTDGQVEPRKVKAGRRENGQIEVLSGLSAGETIVIEGFEGLEKGRQVEIIN